jgi:hypothetical protein
VKPVQWSPDLLPIRTPMVVDGMPDEVYHRDPVDGGSLSHSGLKTILDVPARFLHERENGRAPKDHFDFGHAAHHYVIGVGQRIARIDAADWRKTEAKTARVEARARGHVPMLAHDDDRARRMAEAVRAHRRAGALFDPKRGVAERVFVWFDEEFGVWRRAKFDFLTRTASGRLVGVDYKSTQGKVSPDAIGDAAYKFGYYTQDPYYRDALRALGLDDDPGFLFVTQEKDAPHLVTVSELDAEAKAWGAMKVRQGLARYADCVETGRFPDYADDIVTVSLPRWAEYRLTDEWRTGALDIT